MKDIVILGSRGFAKDVLWLLETLNEERRQWNILGFIDTPSKEEPVPGYGILGDDEWLLQYPHSVSAACGLGAPALRQTVVKKYRGSQIAFPSLVAKSAQVSNQTRLGDGCIICPGVLIAPNTELGDFVSLNLGCTIGHDSKLDPFIMVNPGANISGNVRIGSGCEIGTGACIIQGRRLGPNTVVGAGSVIIRDVPGNCTVVGNPGRILER